ncbi:MAG: hypothetical protein AAF433_04975 [Bacteroidota bacterium]
MNKIWQRLRPLARDLFILITGIMLSLILNELRNNQRAKAEEQRIMQQLISDIGRDTTELNNSITTLEEILTLDDVWRDLEQAPYERYLAAVQLASFHPFAPQQTALQELAYSGQSSNIRRGDLVAAANSLHRGDYATLKEIERLFTDYLVSDFIPYTNDFAPYLIDTTPDEEETRNIEIFLDNPRFKNRADWVVVLIVNNLGALEYAKHSAKNILLQLEAAY